MTKYICILFQKATVIHATIIGADDDSDASKQASELLIAKRECTGYDLWRDGRKIDHCVRNASRADGL